MKSTILQDVFNCIETLSDDLAYKINKIYHVNACINVYANMSKV